MTSFASAAVGAATVPLQNGHRAARVLEICAELDGRSNPAAASDIAAGVMLARMAVTDCALNVDANLPLIKTPGTHQDLEDRARALKDLGK